MSRICLPLCVAVFFGIAAEVSAAQVSAERSKDGVVVKIDGQPFTEYVTRSGSKPILWPILSATGLPVTRAYPMDPSKQEDKKDHIHHRSLWFTHGEINGVNFWAEESKKKDLGTIIHRRFVKTASGPQGLIVTENDWIGPDGQKKVCEDLCRFTFGADGANRWIDMTITLKASYGPVTFGDTKEGTFGIRVADTVRVTAKKGGKIVNSEGLVDDAAWAQRASWVDYYGPIADQTIGVAVMNHPGSFRYPTYWHVRTYGLFAANPFGLKDFTKGKLEGAFTLEEGKSITLRYRVLVHQGDEKQGKVAEAYAAFAKEPFLADEAKQAAK